MDYRCIILALFNIVEICSKVSASNHTTSATNVTATTERDDDEKLFGNPFWLGFTVILFISLLILSLAISLTFGIRKFRQNAKRRGLYKDKNRIYNKHEENSEQDYTMFQTEGVTNAAYIGSS